LNDNTLFWKIFARRSAFCFFISMLLFLTCILRVAVTATTDYLSAQTSFNRLKLTVTKQRGTIFDCNMVHLTNNTKKIIAAVSPTPRAITALSSVLRSKEKDEVLQQLKIGKPVLCEVPEKIECDGIVCTEIFVNNENDNPAIHLLGYTDKDCKGVSGVSAAYDSILYSESEVSVLYECDGKGRILEGTTPIVENDTSVVSNGVVTTIDVNIQAIAENAANYLETGAIVIADAANGKIRASVSRPTFNSNEIEEYLTAADSPLLNRALNAYNVGSVFKPCVAIAGIENNLSEFHYNCTGSCEIVDRFFKCHKREGHGFLNLNSAIANSCNTYFYNYAFKIGKDKIYNTASSLRFGKALKVCNGIYTAKGSLPSSQTLSNIAQLANFSIGQGELLLSPVSILTLYSAIASGGLYYVPSVVEGTLQNGSFTEYDIGNPTRVMQKNTADILKNHLSSVLTDGTGKTAQPQKVTAAGKTATAQTGKYENGVEICEGWFCGFFPVENPQYVVVVFSENTLRQSLTCGEIFAQIADKIAELKSIKQTE